MEKKPHLVKWLIVSASKKKKGPSVKCLFVLNKALLCKWIWRFANERDLFGEISFA